jgi:hypothetical protein
VQDRSWRSFEQVAGILSARRPVPARRSELDLFGDRQSIVNLYSKIAPCAFQLGVAKQPLCRAR